jgi:hypothetical protein
MSDYDLKLLLLGGFILLLLLFWLIRRDPWRKRKISAILAGKNTLANWKYTPEEWQEYTGMAFFDRIKRQDIPGEAYITPTAIYVTNGYDQFFRDLEESGKVVTRCSFDGKSPAVLHIRVRWAVKNVKNENDVKYFKDDIRIPVPNSAAEQANRVVQYFTAQAEGQGSAIQAVTPDDAVSLFGGDKF